MYAEIITIGDEILIGQVVDSNSAFIAEKLNKIGISVYQITSVQDDKTHILKALSEAENNADIVIITGGLGPTKDDITKKTLTHYFNDVLVQNPAVLKHIETLWKKYIKEPLAQVNIDQALVPSQAKILMNHFGSAPGLWMSKDKNVFISLPGVPYEMKALMNNDVIPRLQNTFKLPFILHKTLLTYGLGESRLAARIEQWQEHLPSHFKLAYLPNLGKVRLRLSAKGNDKEMIMSQMEFHINKLLPQIKDVFVGFEDEYNSLEAIIGKQLTTLKKTLATAESCTGGKIAQQITAIPGASSFFKGSVVSYATQAKVNILNISQDKITAHGVVSAPIAEAMALNVKRMFDVDYAISTTGNAGPTKGDLATKLGTVFIAIATPQGVYSQKFQLGNHRIKVIQKAVNKSFEMLHQEISKNLNI